MQFCLFQAYLFSWNLRTFFFFFYPKKHKKRPENSFRQISFENLFLFLYARYTLSFAVYGDSSLTRAVESTLFHNPGGELEPYGETNKLIH